MRLGFFEHFQGGNTVLLEGLPSDIEQLVSTLGKLISSDEPSFPIHSLASVGPEHAVQLFARCAPISPGDIKPNQFVWHISSKDLPAVLAKLLELSRSPRGHQYFELFGSAAQLLVCVGEYGESWWSIHG
ncbi:MAG: hypothetical protein PHR30_18820 [Gallionellaceae bacterium]|nr:hypothetical protein [Gallionellaceae bacterium]